MALPNMVVTGNLKEVLGNVVSSELVESALSRARVSFTSNVPNDAFVKWGGSLYRVMPVQAIVNSDGDIVLDDGDESPVRLLAQDDGLNIRGLQWQVRIDIPSNVLPSAPAGRMRSFWFNAPGDSETINLKDVLPSLSEAIHDPPGEVGDDVAWAFIQGKPDFIGAGTTAANARAAIDAAPTNGVVYATGVVKDGVTDASSTLASRINALASGSVLQLDAGTYYIPHLRDVAIHGNVTIRGVPGMTRLLGNGVLAANLYGNPGSEDDVMFKLQPAASISVEDLIIEDAGILIGLECLTEVGDINVLRCDFIGGGGVLSIVNKSASFLAGMADDKLLDFRNLRVIDCNISGCELGVAAWGYGGWEFATVSGCNFNDVGMIGVWIGSEGVVSGSLARDPDVYQPVQSGVSIHDNVFRHIRPTNYASSIDDEAVNGIAVWGQGVSIHDNYLEDIDIFDKWDDCEGIYVKARYFDIHDNVLINAGGSEASIMLKGGGWEASTTLHSSMNGLTLPRSTLTVTNTDGFPGTVNDGIGSVSNALVMTSAGWQVIHWTGKTGTTLTGVTGGTGTMSTGGVVRGSVHSGGYLEGQSYPGSCRDNTIVFTRTDRQYNGIGIGVPKVVVTGNLIRGSTGRAVTVFYFCSGGVVSQNRIVDHHGSYVFGVSASDWAFSGNTISNFDGSYVPGAGGLYVFWVYAAVDNATVSGVAIKGNTILAPLKSDGTLSAASAKTTIVAITGVGASGVVDKLVVSGNSGRNQLYGIKVSTGVTVTNLSDVDNDWKNDAGSAPVVDTALATIAAVRPIAGVATLAGTETLTNKTLDNPRANIIRDTNGVPALSIAPTASAVNYLGITNKAAGSAPTISAIGTDTNIDILTTPKGSGSLRIFVATGLTPTLQGSGADTNHDLNLLPKGTGVVKANGVEVVTLTGAQALASKTLTAAKIVDGGFIADANGNEAVVFGTVASAVNELKISNAATGGRPTLEAFGDDTNIDINIVTKGAGLLRYNGQQMTSNVVVQTMSGKRITPRTGTVSTSATPTINTDNIDHFTITALATAITSMTTNLTGTPTDGERLRIRFKDNGTGRAITWGAKFVGNLLSTTVSSKTHVQELVYDTVAAAWAGTYVDTAGY